MADRENKPSTEEEGYLTRVERLAVELDQALNGVPQTGLVQCLDRQWVHELRCRLLHLAGEAHEMNKEAG